METTPETNRRNARLAAALFLFLCVPLSIWAQMFVQGKVFVPQDPVATASNLLASEFSFRTSIVIDLVGILLFAFMTTLLYRIFKPVDKYLALLMIVPVLAQIPVVFILEAFNYAAILMLKSEPRPGFGLAEQQETVYFLMRLHRAGASCEKLFLGLSFIPLGMLVWRSGYMPRFFAVLLFISAAGYIADTCTGIILERSIVSIIRPYLRSMFLGYMMTMLWWLIRGVNTEKTTTAVN